MININEILSLAELYYNQCLIIVKTAKIRQLPNGQYRVLSKKNRNLGTYPSKEQAAKRLKQVEYFKHLDKSNADDNTESNVINLTDIDDFSLSAILRKLRQRASKEIVKSFLIIYKNIFDKSVKNKINQPEKIALQLSLIKLNKLCKIKLDKDMIKNAAVTELGDPASVGKYLSDIVRFTITRIKPENRAKALLNLKTKIYNLNENEIAQKQLPASASMGQSITFTKHVLFGQNAGYIRTVLNNIVRYL